MDWLGCLPVPLLALVVFLIAGSQVSLVIDNGALLWSALLVFVLYLVAAAIIGKGLSELFGFTPTTSCTLTFSFGTRNSFVMLPLALSLPEPGGPLSLSLFSNPWSSCSVWSRICAGCRT